MIISSRHIVLITLEHMPEDECSNARYMLWKTMYDYIEQSLILLLKTRIDEGYALLRMAAELSRDIARIPENDNFILWKERANSHQDKT